DVNEKNRHCKCRLFGYFSFVVCFCANMQTNGFMQRFMHCFSAKNSVRRYAVDIAGILKYNGEK
ncbi:MAG: hypothetical protein II313_05985, partial [Anaerotignum sp.]|nr:hypothetical protein [Anaerotignum sp.]